MPDPFLEFVQRYYARRNLVAHAAFVVLLVIGSTTGGLGRRTTCLFVALWLVGFFGLPHVDFGGSVEGSFLVAPYVAMLDIAIIFVIFNRDITIR